MDKILKRDYPDGTSTKVMTSPSILNQNWTMDTMSGSGFNPKNPYNLSFP